MKLRTALVILAVAGTIFRAGPGAHAQPTLPGAGSPQNLENRTISQVVIRGNIRVPESTIRYYIKALPGQQFNEEQLRSDYQALLASGLFSNVRLLTEPRGTDQVVVIFEVTEPPVIHEVQILGLRFVQATEVLDYLREMNLSLTTGSRLDEARLTRAINAVRQFMQLRGFPLARVTVSRQPVATNAVNLTFHIEEGPRAKIGVIEFEGNTLFSDEELRDALKLTSESSFWSSLRGRSLYLEDRLEYDVRANVLPMYQSRGYIFARMEKPRVELVEAKTGGLPGFRRDRLEYRIIIRLVEGEQFRYSGFRVEGVEKVNENEVLSKYKARVGDIVNFVALSRANEQVKRVYGELGFLDMELIPEMRPQYDRRTVDFTIRIREGGRYLVRQINFTGNERTRDKVLRREMVLQEGDDFNADKLDASLLKLSQLDFIEPLTARDYTLTKHPVEEEVDILIRVRERDPHAINLTGGLGGISGTYIGFDYQSRNFRGLGQTLEVQAETGSRTSDYALALTDPHFLDSDNLLSYRVFHRRLRFDSFGLLPGRGASDTFSLFSERSTGFQVTASRPVSSFNRVGVSYSLDTNRVYDIREDFRSFAVAQLILLTTGGSIDEALTGILRSQVTPFWTYDTRNRFFGATHGSYLLLQMPVAGGPFGGRIDVAHPFFEFQRFIPDRLISSRNTWAFRTQLQHVFSYGTLPDGTRKPVPFLERIYFGGESNLRGFDLRSIGPVAVQQTQKVDENGNPIIDPVTGLPTFDQQPIAIGGDAGVVLTAEYRIPIYGPLQFTPFVDVGTATVIRKKDLRVSGLGNANVTLLEETNNVWRMSTGAEIQFLLPVVNQPLRLILAFNPLRLNKTIRLADQNLVFREPCNNVKFSVGYSF
ncbi:MAG: outer membrane protein assembly factor BamA [Acidobacteriota bacterium]